MKNVTTTTMQAINKAINDKAATDLHNVNGIDWNAPGLILLHFEGSYTINKIVKELAAIDNSIPTNAPFLILTCNKGSYYSNNRYYVTRATAAGTFEVERDKSHNRYGYTWGRDISLDDRWRKADFNEDRKSEDCDTYVIYQPGGYKYPKTMQLDLTIRHNVKEVRTCSYRYWNDNTYTTYIDNIDFTDGTTYHTPYRAYQQGTEGQIVDKSGYITAEQKQDYKRRAQALREERQKAAAAATDFTKTIADLKQKAAALKSVLIAQLTITDNPEMIEKIGGKLYRYGNLATIYKAINNFEEAANNKTFRSIEAAEKRAAEIEAKINTLIEE